MGNIKEPSKFLRHRGPCVGALGGCGGRNLQRGFDLRTLAGRARCPDRSLPALYLVSVGQTDISWGTIDDRLAREAPHRGAATPSLDAKTERELYWDNWKEWFRRDFLRSCFVAGSLAWDGLGAIQVRYLLDPYYPGQGASGAWVYSIILGFLILSSVGQLFLYRLWWPPRETGSLPGARWTEFAWFRQRFGR